MYTGCVTKNPFLNALAASGYILVLVSVMTWGSGMAADKPDSFLAPVAMISLFTLSAAVMGYVFCYTPLMLYFDGKKKQAVNLFLHTMGVFAGFTFIALVLAFLGVGI